MKYTAKKSVILVFGSGSGLFYNLLNCSQIPNNITLLHSTLTPYFKVIKSNEFYFYEEKSYFCSIRRATIIKESMIKWITVKIIRKKMNRREEFGKLCVLFLSRISSRLPACLPHRQIDWLSVYLTVWLSEWLTDCFLRIPRIKTSLRLNSW